MANDDYCRRALLPQNYHHAMQINEEETVFIKKIV